MNHRIEGLLPVLHTPFLENDEMDRESLGQEIDWVFQVGADGVCAAMVSEILRLTKQERMQLTEWIVELTADRGPVITSVGAENMTEALEYAHHAKESGCSAIMAIPPVEKSSTEQDLLEYFSTLADSVDLPLIVQDASSYVGEAMSVSFFSRLFETYGPEKILFKPEANPVGPNLSALRDATNGRAKIFDGSGGILLVDCYQRGITGTMPGVDLLDGIVALWNALKEGDEKKIYEIYFPICAIVALQLQAGLDGFLAIEKHILVRRGIFPSDRRRKPYSWEMDQETRDEVNRLLDILIDVLEKQDDSPG